MAKTGTVDPLDEPVDSAFRFRFASIPVSAGLRVHTPPVWAAAASANGYFNEEWLEGRKMQPSDLDECFFCIDIEIMDEGYEPKTIELPEGFYCNEFLALNPFDVLELLRFQQSYGLVYGARKKKPFGTELMQKIRPEPDENVFAGIDAETYANQLAGICRSAELFDTVADKEVAFEYEMVRLGAVSFRETISAVLDAQHAIRATTRVLRGDLEPMTRREIALAKIASEYVAHFLPKTFPSIELIVEGQPERTCDLITAVFAQLARGLLNNEAYRLCANPECSRLFTPREMGRRLDTRYCSAKCQERAKRIRYVAHQAKNSSR